MTAPPGPGLMRKLAIVFVIAGVPIGFAGFVLAGDETMVTPGPLYLAMLLLLAYVMVDNHQELLRRRTHRLFYLFFTVLLVASMLTAATDGGSAAYSQIAMLAGCFVWSSALVVLFFLVRTPAQVRLAIRSLDAIGVVTSLSVYLAYVLPRTLGMTFGESVSIYGEDRAFGPLGDNVGFVVALFVLCSASDGRWLRAGFHTGAVLITGTRGALVTLLVGAACLAFAGLSWRWAQGGPHRRRTTLALLSGSLVAIGFLWSPFGEAARSRLLETSLTAGSGRQRLDAMALGCRVWLDNPFFGVGFLGFRNAITHYDISDYFELGGDLARGTFTAQNQYIQTATDAGVFGLAALGLLFWVVLANLRRARARADAGLRAPLLGYEAWIVGILLGNQTAVWLLPSAATGYFVFLVVGLTERIAATLEPRSARTPAPALAGGIRARAGVQ